MGNREFWGSGKYGWRPYFFHSLLFRSLRGHSRLWVWSSGLGELSSDQMDVITKLGRLGNCRYEGVGNGWHLFTICPPGSFSLRGQVIGGSPVGHGGGHGRGLWYGFCGVSHLVIISMSLKAWVRAWKFLLALVFTCCCSRARLGTSVYYQLVIYSLYWASCPLWTFPWCFAIVTIQSIMGRGCCLMYQ